MSIIKYLKIFCLNFKNGILYGAFCLKRLLEKECHNTGIKSAQNMNQNTIFIVNKSSINLISQTGSLIIVDIREFLERDARAICIKFKLKGLYSFKLQNESIFLSLYQSTTSRRILSWILLNIFRHFVPYNDYLIHSRSWIIFKLYNYWIIIAFKQINIIIKDMRIKIDFNFGLKKRENPVLFRLFCESLSILGKLCDLTSKCNC